MLNVLLVAIALLTFVVGYLIYIVQSLNREISLIETKIYGYVNSVNESTIEISTKVINEGNDVLKNIIVEELTSIETKVNDEINGRLDTIKNDVDKSVQDYMQTLLTCGQSIQAEYDKLNSTINKSTKKTTKKNGI